jgi:4-hydroxybenzoate polyprenyltransferase
MRQSSASAPTFFLPRGARILLACFMLAVSALAMWDKFLGFDWVGFLCFGLYFLVHVPRQKGEAPKAYFSKPSTIISFALLIVMMAFALHSIYFQFTKHRF